MIDRKTINRDLVMLLADIHFLRENGDFLSIVMKINQSINKFQDVPELYRIWALSNLYLGLRDGDEHYFEEAVNGINRAIMYEPNNDQFHVDLGEVYALGILDYEKAYIEYNKALEINGLNQNAILGIVALFGVPESIVDSTEIDKLYRKLILIEPNISDYHYNYGQVLERLGEVDVAINEYRKALCCMKENHPMIHKLSKERLFFLLGG